MFNWIASYPKSGNTWMRLMLAHYHGYTDPNCTGPFSWHDTSEWAFNRIAPVPGKFDEYESYALKPAALFQIMVVIRSFGEQPWLKTHAANVNPGGLPQIPGELTKAAVCIVRDPRDVAVSYAHHMGKSYDDAVSELCNDGNALKGKTGIQQYLGSWNTHVESWRKHKKAIMVRYEDLVDDPVGGLWSVLAHFGIDPDHSKVQAAVEATRFHKLKDHEKETGFRESVRDEVFFRSGTTGQWQNELTDEQVRKIEETNQPMMETMGYEVSVYRQRSA